MTAAAVRPAIPALLASKQAALTPASVRAYSVTNPSAPVGTPEFDPNAVTAMDKQTPPEPGSDFNVVIVGA